LRQTETASFFLLYFCTRDFNKPRIFIDCAYKTNDRIIVNCMSDDKFKNQYRIPSNRWQEYDYRASGMYFVTVCTKGNRHFFGQIVDGEFQPSAIGEVAKNEWLKTAELRPDMNLTLDEFVIMPNHFHGIIFIGENQYNSRDAMHCVSANPHGDAKHCVSTGRHTDASQCVGTESGDNKFGAQSKNLASIIRGFKMAVTTFARKNNINFAWQERYHDHVIRDNDALQNIRAYIYNNPANWLDDELNTVETQCIASLQ